MSERRSLAILMEEDFRQELATDRELTAFFERNPDFNTILQKCKDPSIRNTGLRYLNSALIVKAGSEREIIGITNTRFVTDRYLQLCMIIRVDPKELMRDLNLTLIREIMNCESLDDIFEIGKVINTLEDSKVESDSLKACLDISYSPAIFNQALDKTKLGIIKGLRALIEAKELELDSTGALQAIVGNALKWVEDTNDFHQIKASLGQPVEQDIQGAKEINALLSKIDLEGHYENRKIELLNKYGMNEIVINYKQDINDSNKPIEVTAEFTAEEAKDEIKSINEIEILGDPLKISNNLAKTIYTYLYLGKIKRTKTQVAIKKIKVNDASLLNNFNVEVKITRELSNRPQFLKFYGSFRVDKELYIIMEYIEWNLMEVMSSKPIPELAQIKITNQLLEGFAFMAQKRIYHRDIKPQNMLVTEDFNIKIIDFGITAFDQNPNVTTSAHDPKYFIQGTIGWMSPEQKKAYKANDNCLKIEPYNLEKSDVYSLGLTLFAMITLRDVSKFEEGVNNNELLNDINRITSLKMRNLLFKMLHLQQKDRCTFKVLLGEFYGNTVTNI